jgi:hypothetical protein
MENDLYRVDFADAITPCFCMGDICSGNPATYIEKNTPSFRQISWIKCQSYFAGEGDINLQLTVKVYNINEGKNLDTETIAKATGLTPEEVVNLTNK